MLIISKSNCKEMFDLIIIYKTLPYSNKGY